MGSDIRLYLVAGFLVTAHPTGLIWEMWAKTRAYEADVKKIQTAVDAFYSKPGNTRFIGKRQYPIIGRAQTSQTNQTLQTTSTTVVDDRDPFNTSSDLYNPIGGTEGADLSATSVWLDDDSDGVRDIDASSGTADSWTTVSVTSQGGTVYHTDPRYFFIDFEALIDDGFLKAIPDSAALDNLPSGSTQTYSGNYIYYLDDNGSVQTLYVDFADTTTSVSGVYP